MLHMLLKILLLPLFSSINIEGNLTLKLRVFKNSYYIPKKCIEATSISTSFKLKIYER